MTLNQSTNKQQVDLPMRDGRASGTAFIVFASADGVNKAVELNEATFGAFFWGFGTVPWRPTPALLTPTHAMVDG
jgi:hypothetical protein